MKKLQLILTNPCAENWDEMQPSKVGRYCDTCTKHIVDLTNKSDTELIAFFKKKKNNVCGRLLSTQLHRDIVVPPQKINWHWLLPVALGASIFTPAKAAELRPATVQNGALFPSLQKINQTQSATKTVVDTIKGRVLDGETGKPLANVKIKRKGFNNVIALTDSTGNFVLSVKEEGKTDTLIFELNGYNVIEKPAVNEMIVKMNERAIILGGISSISVANQPLYVITSGNKSCTVNDVQSKNILPEWIDKIDILKDAKATALYGSKAANGVIIMKIKKKYAHKVDFSKKN
jgi:TonB-dependent SusC/RagA subfamily outer membrane receptor